MRHDSQAIANRVYTVHCTLYIQCHACGILGASKLLELKTREMWVKRIFRVVIDG